MSLIAERFVTEVAFRWSGTIRVFQADSMRIAGEEDNIRFRLADGSVESVTQQIWLLFDLRFRWLKRISPATSAGNDYIDLRNAFVSGLAVDIYPIYDVDPTVLLTVKASEDTIKVLETDRWLVKPAFNLQLITAASLDSYPVWLRSTYQK